MSRLPYREISRLEDVEEKKWTRWRTFNSTINAGPAKPGIYEFAVRDERLTQNQFVVVYVGTSNDLNRRHAKYLSSGSHKSQKFKEARDGGYAIWMRYQTFDSAEKAYVRERFFLRTFNYAWNKVLNHKVRPTQEAVENAMGIKSQMWKVVPLRKLSDWEVEIAAKQGRALDSAKKAREKKKVVPIVAAAKFPIEKPGGSKLGEARSAGKEKNCKD